MKPYFKVKQQRHAVIGFPGQYVLTVDVTKNGRNYEANFIVPEMTLTRSQARAFVKACDMAVNFSQKAGAEGKGGAGGSVPHEFNDGRDWFWADKEGSYRVSCDDSLIYVPATVVAAPRMRRIKKLVQEAIRKQIARPIRSVLLTE